MNASVRSLSATPHAGEREFPFGDAEFAFIAELVFARSGIVLGPSKQNMVYSRLVRRLRELGLPTFSDYCDLVGSPDGADEIGHLINAITTNLTRFFRENHHFEHLGATVVPDLAKRDARRIRIWSAGCSSGEEPYSIAITVADRLAGLGSFDVKILATDLDTNMVAHGRAGIYGRAALEGVPGATVAKHFKREPGGDRFAVRPPARDLITFKPLNLLGPWPMKGPFDAIFCRNVMIYFDNPTKFELVRRFSELLAPGGWLYIGHAETLLGQQEIFKTAGRTIYRKIES
ncbi:CheR family methyltransferase [Methyloraptor flagellatus]|uniref:Chemotaxis protein methyltransferase n=1 Tax=Methyloraptor flagellatus TaxID=3162530 RepID=A0AAU7X9C3_9HYPH